MLERYAYLNNFSVKQIKYNPPKAKTVPKIVLKNQSLQATYPQVSESSNPLIMVHNINEYRKKGSALFLIPDVNAEIDKLLFTPKEVPDCFTL